MVEDVPEEHPVVLFDGVCDLCNGFVAFLIRRDPERRFRFAPLQSAVGERLLEEHGLDDEDLDSMVLVDGEDAYVKSGAVIRSVSLLGGAYRLLAPFRFVPRPVRDFAYDAVAARRYRWFGKRDRCMAPTPDVAARFLAGGPASHTPADE